MNQPLRAPTNPEQDDATSAEPHTLKESVRRPLTLVTVPQTETKTEPCIARTYSRRLMTMAHPLQIRMLSHVIAYSLIVFGLLAAPVFHPLMQALDNPTLSWQERAVVANDLLNLHDRFWPWAIAASVVVMIQCLHSLRLMHRVAGPLYRLQHVFPQIGDGNLNIRTTLRQGDYLDLEADLVNQMTAQLQTKIKMIKQAQVTLTLDTTRFKELAAMKNDPALAALANQMEQNVAGLKASLDAFKTHSR